MSEPGLASRASAATWRFVGRLRPNPELKVSRSRLARSLPDGSRYSRLSGDTTDGDRRLMRVVGGQVGYFGGSRTEADRVTWRACANPRTPWATATDGEDAHDRQPVYLSKTISTSIAKYNRKYYYQSDKFINICHFSLLSSCAVPS
jgi:hypothetical protein